MVSMPVNSQDARGDAGSLRATSPSLFNAERAAQRLAADIYPIESLKAQVHSLCTSTAQDPVAHFFCESLKDAGLYELPDDAPVWASWNRISHLPCLDIQGRVTPATVKGVRRVETALIRSVWAFRVAMFQGVSDPAFFYEVATQMDCHLASTLAPDLHPATAPQSEWQCRSSVAQMLTSLPISFRTDPDFRLNRAQGLMAFSFTAPDPELVPRRLAPTGGKATRSERASYAAQVSCSLTLALCALGFSTSSDISQVWVEARNPADPACPCLLSAQIDRTAFDAVDLDRCDAREVLATWDAVHLAADKSLAPIAATFSLAHPALSPKDCQRAPLQTSSPLEGSQAQGLGASWEADLACSSDPARELAAETLCRQLTGSCAHDVHVILAAVRKSPDDLFCQAGEHVVQSLIDGTLDGDDPDALVEAFVGVDTIAPLLKEAHRLLCTPGASPNRLRQLKDAIYGQLLARGDLNQPDTANECYRWFSTYAERQLYNCLISDERQVHLVSNLSFQALGILTRLAIRLKDFDQALAWGLRAVGIAPLYANASLRLARILRMIGDQKAAKTTLCSALLWAHDPEAIGALYLSLGSLLADIGATHQARAALKKAAHLGVTVSGEAQVRLSNLEKLPAHVPHAQSVGDYPAAAVAQGTSFSASGGAAAPDPRDASDAPSLADEEILESAGIPLAPTPQVDAAVAHGAEAAVDAGLFCVGRDLAGLLGLMRQDRTMVSMVKSLV